MYSEDAIKPKRSPSKNFSCQRRNLRVGATQWQYDANTLGNGSQSEIDTLLQIQ